LRPGEEKIKGVDCAIDAAGYQARSDDDPSREKATQVLENCVRVVNATGSVGMIGVYVALDPGAASEHAKKAIFPLAIAEFFDQGITAGQRASARSETQRISAI
jgi:glutathione-independent formaldehyde dehydrogenase